MEKISFFHIKLFFFQRKPFGTVTPVDYLESDMYDTHCCPMRLLTLLSFFLIFSTGIRPLTAQVSSDSSGNHMTLNHQFNRQNTSWDWRQNILVHGLAANGWQWHLEDRFRGQAFTSRSLRNQWKDENNFNGSLLYPLNNHLQLGMYATQWILGDRQPVQSNVFANWAGGVRARFQPIAGVDMTPQIGYQLARTNHLLEWGWDTGMAVDVRDVALGAYRTRLRARSEYDFFETRKSFDNSAAVRFFTRFSPLTQDSLRVVFGESVKQFYNPSATKLLNVAIYNRQASNHLMYRLGDASRLDLINRLSSKHINYFTSRDIFLMENLVRYNYWGATLQYALEFRTGSESIDNTGIRTDSETRQSGLGAQIQWHVTGRQTLSVQLNYNKLQYDTPDSLYNFDDRDEQRFIMNLNYTYRFSPYLDVGIRFYSYWYHQIYIYREQSINNNRNRVLKLEPVVSYRNGGWRNTFRTSVIADFTEYDFDALNLTPRSFLYRKYTVSDSLSRIMPHGCEAGMRGRLELEEKGSFFASTFSQNIIQSYRVAYVSGYIRKTIWRRMNVQIGYNYFARNEWRYFPVKRLNRVIANSGPFVRFTWLYSKKLSWSAFASVNHYDDSLRGAARTTTGYLRFNYLL
ncbi:MAG: hypothetical protein D6677_00265 [Calditrichaeota bacterium]|nr:MAG: hypothetical protein D6677_00265 [Calditrichota bacterium]